MTNLVRALSALVPLLARIADSISTPRVHTPAPESSNAPILPESSALNIRSVAIAVIATLASVFALQWAREILIPVVLGVLISYALEPIVKRLARWKIPRALGAALVIISIVSGAGYLGYSLRNDAVTLLDRLPAAVEKISGSLNSVTGNVPSTIEKLKKATQAIEKAAQGNTGAASVNPDKVPVAVVPVSHNLTDYLWTGSLGALTFLGQATLVLFLVYFLLSSGDLFKRKLVKISGTKFSEKKITVQILEEINTQIERFLVVQLFTNSLVGVLIWLSFKWIGLENAAVWGAAAGFLHAIPYIGPIIITGGSALVGFLQFGALSEVLLIGGASLGITTLVGMLLLPWITSRAAKMNAGAVFIGLLFFGWIWGVWGLLLGTPILMSIKAVCDRVENLQDVGELLGD